MKKIFLLAILIITSLTLFFLNKNDTTLSVELSDFAVEDTASIQKVFFADKHGNSVTVSRDSDTIISIANKNIFFICIVFFSLHQK